jgi:hypothetical protein
VKSGSWGVVEGLSWGGYGDLFHLGCLCTLVLIGVGGGIIMCGGFNRNLVVACRNLDSRFGMFIVTFLWCIHNILTASVSMHVSLFISGSMVGFVYIIVSGGKCMVTCMSNIVLYGASFVVQSSSGMVRIVMVFWFSFAARRA